MQKLFKPLAGDGRQMNSSQQTEKITRKDRPPKTKYKDRRDKRSDLVTRDGVYGDVPRIPHGFVIPPEDRDRYVD